MEKTIDIINRGKIHSRVALHNRKENYFYYKCK